MQIRMSKYSDVPMDYADAMLVAVAESLGIRDILTLDRRGFSDYRYSSRGSFRIFPEEPLTRIPFQEPVRFLVDPSARTDRDDFYDIPRHPINDPEGSHPETAQAGKLVFQRPPRRGNGENRLKRRPGLPLQGRMHAADKISDLVRYPEPVKRLFQDGSLSKQFIECVQARFFPLQ
jgi:hypothetical protein